VSHLGEFSLGGDEGFNLMKARMVHEGYSLYRDIWSDEPPLLVHCLALAFDLFGESVLVARAVMVAFACLGLLSTAWMARLLGGRVGSLVAFVFLAFAPRFAYYSRSVMVGLPAHALAVLAMACGLMGLRTMREVWMVGAGLACAGSMLTKPLHPFLVVPLGIIIWYWGRSSEGTGWNRWGRKLVLLTTTVAVPLLVVLGLFGGAPFVEQVVGTYLERQQSVAYRFSQMISDAVAHVVDGGLLHWTGLGMAIYGFVVAWHRRDGGGIAVSVWLLGAVIAVCSQTRFRVRYLLVPTFPLAGLLSIGLREAIGRARLAWTRPRRWVSLAAGCAVVVCLVLGTAHEARHALAETCCREYPDEEQAVAMLESIGAGGGYAISDNGILLFRAGLLTPPELAATSFRRIETGQLSAETLIAISRTYEPRAIVLWSKRLATVSGYVDWVERHYCLAKAWSDTQYIYVSCDLMGLCDGCVAQLGDFSGIVGWNMSTPATNDRVVAPGGSMLLTVHWQTMRPTDADYHIFCHLGDETLVAQWDGRPRQGEYPTYRWFYRERVTDSYPLEVRADASPGYYPLWVGMYDASTKDRLPVADAEGNYVGSAVLLTHVRVGHPEFEAPPITRPQEAVLGDGVRLLGYDLPSDEARAGDLVDLTLYWQCVQEMDASYTVFLHIVDSEGNIVGQWDSIPQGGGLPTTVWVSGEVMMDIYEVPVISEADPASYTVAVGMYDARTGQRLAATGAEGVRLPDDRILLGSVRLSK